MGVELFEPEQRRIDLLVGKPFVDADIAVGANINANKIGTGIVDNTEFDRLNGITSALEEQGNKGAVSGYAGLNASQKLLLTNFPAGTALQHLRRNAGNTALEFIDPPGEVFTWTANHDANGFALEDPLFADPITTTKLLDVSLVNMTALVTLTLSFSQSSTQTLQVPNITALDTLVTNNFAATLTNKTLALGTNTISGTAAEFDIAVTDDNFAYVSDNLSVFAATTSLQLEGVISDETGSGGALVFASSPAIVTPTIASFVNATHSHLNATGGGTITAAAVSDFDTQVRTSRLDQMATPTASVSFGSQLITTLLDPVSAQDAATKNYVDAIAINGVKWKESARIATTTNDTLSGLAARDGITPIAGDRVLVKNQTLGENNGLYDAAVGAWARSTDADTSAEILQMAVFTEEGTENADQGFVLITNAPIVLGTTVLVYTQFTGLGQITAGAGLTKTGNTLDVGGTTNRISVSADAVDIDAAYVGQASITTLGTIATGAWEGTIIAKAFLPATVVHTDQTNTFGGFAQTFSNDTLTLLDSAAAEVLIRAAVQGANRQVTFPALAVSLGEILITNVGQTITSSKIFNDLRLFLRNAADTFDVTFTNTVTADRILTLPDAAGTVVITGLSSQITIGTEVTGASTALTDTADIAYLNTANTFIAGNKNTFAHSATTAGFAVLPVAGNPSGQADGDLWLNLTTQQLFARINGANVDLGGGGSQTPWTSDIDAGGFDLNDLSNILFRNSAGVPLATDRSIHYNDAEGMVFNALTGDFFQLEINGIAEYNFNATDADWLGNNLRNFGFIESNAANVALDGEIRLAEGAFISWRNSANTDENSLRWGPTNQFEIRIGPSIEYSFTTSLFSMNGASIVNLGGTTDSSVGVIRMPNNIGDLGWRNSTNSFNLLYGVNSSNEFEWEINSISELTLSAATLDVKGNDIRNFGFIESDAANVALDGIIRLAAGAKISWRNSANTDENELRWGASDTFEIRSGPSILYAFSSSFINMSSSSIVELGGSIDSSVGVLRMPNNIADLGWRNAANTFDLLYGVNASDNFEWEINSISEMTLSATTLTLGSGNNFVLVASGATGFMDMGEITLPANPGVNVGRLYVKDLATVTTLFFLDNAGTETNVLTGTETFTWSANHDANGFALLDARFADDVDATKIIDLNLSGMTTGIVLTLLTAQTTAQTITIPNTTGADDFVLEDFSQPLTNKTIDSSLNTISNIVNADLSGSAAITFANLQNIATNRLLGRNTAASGVIEELTHDTTLEFNVLELRRAAITGDISIPVASNVAAISAGVILDADVNASAGIVLTKLQNIATDRLLGRETVASGSIEEISLNATLELVAATTLQRAALTGDVTAGAGSNATTVANVPDGALSANVVLETISNTYAANTIQTFTPDASNAGINVGSFAGEPTGANGELVYDSTANQMKGFVNGAWVDLGQSGAEVTNWTADHSTNGNSFLLTDDATPPAGTVAAIYLETGELNFNVAATNLHQFRINDVIEMTLNDTQLDLLNNNLILGTGILQFVDADQTIQNIAGNLIYDVVTGQVHLWRINNVTEMQLSATALAMQGNAVLQVAFLTSNAADPSTAGTIRLGNAQSIDWRNAGNTANLGFLFNASDRLAFGSTTEIFDSNIFTNHPALATGDPAADTLLIRDATDGLIKEIFPNDLGLGGGSSFTDAAFDIHDEVNTTARVVFNLDGAAAGFDTTLDFNGTVARTITFPDATTTVVGTGIANQIADTEITAHTSTKITITAKGQLNANIVYNDQTNVFGDFNQDFKDNRIRIFNPGDTFAYTIIASAIASALNVTLPLITVNTNLVVTDFANVWGTSNQNIAATGEWQEAGTAISPIGTHDDYYDAGMMVEVTSAIPDTVLIGTTGNRKGVLKMDYGAADEFGTIKLTPPRNWDAGTITVIFKFTTGVEGAGTIIWGVSGVAVADLDDLAAVATDYGTEVTVTDTQTNINEEQFSPRTTAITLANTPVAGDSVYLKIRRDGAVDTFPNIAFLLGIFVEWGINAATAT